MLIKITLYLLFYAGFLWLTPRLFTAFSVRPGALAPLTLLLTLLDFVLGNLLQFLLNILALPAQILTLFMLSDLIAFLVGWAANVAVLWTVTRFSDSLRIRERRTLWLSGALLSVAGALAQLTHRLL